MPRNCAEEPRFLPGSYHTDGQRLLRIVGEVSDDALCAVEDCRNLELLLIPVDELDSLRLTPVKSGAR
jgi:hypothetical protein